MYPCIQATEAINPASDFDHYFAGGSRPASQWKIGSEVELFGFDRQTLQRIPPDTVQRIIEGFSPQTVTREIEDGFVVEAALIDTANPDDKSSSKTGGRITLEPGGQVEFSASPYRSLIALEKSLRSFLSHLSETGQSQNVVFIATGFDPIRGISEQRWIPKRRYEIMKPYLAKRGRRAWDMMCRTAAVQVHIDYRDIEDLTKKFQLANRLGPVAAAIFANSPFEQGRLSGYKSTRYAVWLETDPDRTGLSPLGIQGELSASNFLKYISKVPMLFIRRDGNYLDYTGHSFDEFIAGCECPERAIFQDFTDHLSTIFTEARLKPHIEQRSIDSCSLDLTMADMAFWKGLMYHPDSLDQAMALAPQLSRNGFVELQADVARRGLEAEAGGISVSEIAQAMIELARAGLKEIAPDEAGFLDILDQITIRERICPADILIRNFEGAWNRDIRKAIDHLQI
jgi:glutamate--cysteine ligase